MNSGFLEEWDTQENLKIHLRSELFRILRGAMNLLKEPHEMVFHTDFHPKEEEGVDGSPRVVRSEDVLRFAGTKSKDSEI